MKKVLKKKKKEELCNFSKKGKYEIAYLGCCPPPPPPSLFALAVGLFD
jgi:hypothetical protein